MKIELTEKQARIVMNALDYYFRVAGMGQLEEIWSHYRFTSPLPSAPLSKPSCDQVVIEDAINALKYQLWGLPGNASYGITQTKEEYQIACEIMQQVRCCLSWWYLGKDPEKDKRDWSEMIGVNYDKPFKMTDEPLPKISKN
jgi:hypothetical protein